MRSKLVDPHLGTAQVKRALIMNLVAPVMFILSIGLALINAEASAYSWLLMFFARRAAEWIFKVPRTGNDLR